MSGHNLTAAEFTAELTRAQATLGVSQKQAFEIVRQNLAFLNRPDRAGGPLGVTVDGVPVERVEWWEES